MPEGWVPTGFTGLNDDAWELLDEKRQEVRAAQELLIGQQVTFDQAVNAASISEMAPVASADLAIGSSMMGLTFDDPLFTEILAREQHQNEVGQDMFDKSWEAAKTGLRVGFLGMQTFWDEGLLSAGLRTGVQMAQGQNPVDAYRRSGTSAGVEALATVLEGDQVDLGTGIMPGFTPIDESPAFARSMTELSGSGLSNDEIVERSLQSHFDEVGKPVVPMQQEVAESTLIHNTRGGRDWTSPVSIGRLPAIQMFSPGSKPFHYFSGGIDFTAQILADPTDRALSQWALFRKARNSFMPDVPQGLDAARVAQQLENKAQVAQKGGLFGNTRFTTHKRKVTDWALNEGKDLREFLVGNKDIRAIDAIFPDLKASAKRQLVDAEDIAAVDAILLPELGTSVTKIPGGRSLLVPEGQTMSQRVGGAMPARGDTTQAVGRLGGMGSRIGYNSYANPLTRVFSEMHRSRLLASDPESTFTSADDFMRNAGFSKETANEFLYELAGNSANDIERLFETSTKMMDEYGRILVEQGWTEEMAKAQTELFGQQTIARVYNQDDLGNPILLSSTFEFGETANLRIDLPEAHLLSEYLDWGVTLPDARRVRRGRSKLRRTRRDVRKASHNARDWVNKKVNFSLDEGVKYSKGEQAVVDMTPEGFEATGDVLHYGQRDYHEVIPEGSTVRMNQYVEEADAIAGRNIGLEEYDTPDMVEAARMAYEDPMVVRPDDFSSQTILDRFPDELGAGATGEATEFTNWFDAQRTKGGTFHVFYERGRNWREIKTPAAMRRHIDNGARMRFQPKVRKQTVKSLRSWYGQQLGEGHRVQVRLPKPDGGTVQPWHIIETEDNFITAMGRNAEVRVLPQGRAAPVTSAKVYGNTLNVGTMPVSQMDPDLVKALKADGILDEAGELVEGDIPLNQTQDWMVDNGYGKFTHEDDSIEALEEFMGYNTDSVYDDLTKGTEYSEFVERSDRMGKFFNAFSLEELGFDPSVATRMLDWYQSNIFKPLALLRAAWFARVTMEENVRMWLEGFDSFVSHPASAVQWTINHNLAGLQKGRTGVGRLDNIVDEAGNSIPVHVYDELIDSRTDHAALSNVMDQMRLGRNGANEVNYGTLHIGDPNYVNGWARDAHQLMATPELGILAEKGIDETIVWMNTTPEGQAMRKNIALDTSPNSPKRAIATDENALRQHLESIDARAHRIGGGEYHMKRSDGQWVSSRNVHEPLQPQPTHPADSTYVIVQTGDEDVVRMLHEGKLGGTDFRAGGRVTKRQYRKITAELEGKVAQGIGPASVKGVADTRFNRIGDFYDEFLSTAFNYLGSKPTNYLSRSPFYRQAHWDAVGRLYRHADDELREFILEGVKEAKLSANDWRKIQKRHGGNRAVPADTRVLTIDDANMVDDIAKAEALARTQRTLYDLSKRKNISDMTRFVFPFGEAWIEMLTVWSRLATQNPRVFRRGQQLINGARSSGFFYENEYGDEVFTVPGSRFLSRAVGLAPEGSSVGMELSVSGMNMITSNPLPGFGTLPQMAGAMVLPTTGTMAEIADNVIYGGFSRPDKPTSPLDLISASVPPWMRHLQTGIGAENSEWANTYASTVNDTAEVMAITGAHPGMTNGDHEGLYNEAKKKASFLFIIKGIAAFGSPSSPQLVWELETAEGSPITLRASKQIWNDVLRKNEYDVLAATSEFYQRVGFDPNYMYRSHYQEKWERVQTQEGYELEVANPEMYANFPKTAAFALPDPEWAEFSFNVHKQRVLQGDKQLIDETTHRALVNIQGGDIEYRNMMNLLEWRLSEMRVSGVPESGITKYETDNKREITRWVKSRWTGWGKDAEAGSLQDVSATDLWEEITLTHGGWMANEEVMATDAGKGLAMFLPLWTKARSQSVAEGLSPDGWLTSDKSIPTQMWIRESIEEIGEEYPDFIQLAREAIVPQLTASRELWYEQNPTSGLIFDYMTSPDPTPSMETIPFEMLQEAG